MTRFYAVAARRPVLTASPPDVLDPSGQPGRPAHRSRSDHPRDGRIRCADVVAATAILLAVATASAQDGRILPGRDATTATSDPASPISQGPLPSVFVASSELPAAGAAATPKVDGPGLAAPKPASSKFEGAIGLIASYDAEYAGASQRGWSFRPAGFLRWGRLSISGAGGFTTKRDDDVERGLAARLVQRRAWNVSLGLRYDNGRSDSESDALAGLGDVPKTVRARLLLRVHPDDAWELHTSVSADVLNRRGGWWADLGARRRWRLTPDTRIDLRTAITWAGDTYMQTWYGVTAEQSARSGYPEYHPREGLRDVSLGATLRTNFGPRWSGYVEGGLSRQLGPAADSPFVTRPGDWSVASGLVWRF
jgi:outer membrane protein